MKVQVLKPFLDLKENKNRTAGEVFILSKERAKELEENLKAFSNDPFFEEVKVKECKNCK